MSSPHRTPLVTLLALLTLLALCAPTLADPAPCPDASGALASASLGDPGGIGGTGIGGDDSGIGGTGLVPQPGGIGGTGIFGTLTGFGSLCVNGLRVHYDPDVSVEINGAAAGLADLAVGQVVWLKAQLDPDGRLHTDAIAVHSAVAGPVATVDAEAGRLEVLGQRIEVPAEAVLAGGLDLTRLAPGQFVDVSGLRRADGAIVASRVERRDSAPGSGFVGPRPEVLVAAARSLERLSIEGYAQRLAPDRARVAGVEVDASGLPRGLEGLARDARVRASGRLTPDRRLRLEPPPRPPRPGVQGPDPLRPERDTPERPVRPERPGRPDRIERPEKIDRPERFDAPVRVR